MVRHSRRGGAATVITKDDEGKTCDGSIVEGTLPAADMSGGRRRSRRRSMVVPKGVHVKAKTLKRLLKSNGLKVSGKKATLRARARKAHLIRGGGAAMTPASV